MSDRPTRALLYLRQSEKRKGEDEASSLSLDAQERAARERCEREGWVVADAVRDHDRKGDDPTRPGMLDLKKRAKTRSFDLVVVLNLSRFARDYVFQELTYRELREYGVRVVSLLEPSIEHTVMRGVLGTFNQYRKEEQGQFVSVSARERAMRGFTWGRVPFGYDREIIQEAVGDRPRSVRLVPNQDAPVVASIFTWWLAGQSLRQIAQRIIDAAITARHNTRWPPGTIAWMLKNPVYAGAVRINRTVTTWDAHEAIVSRETWEAAQLRFVAPRVNEKAVPRSWLEGRIRHSCGARMLMVRITRPYTGGKWPDGYPSFRCHRFSTINNRCTDPRQHVGAPLAEPAARAALILDLRHALTPEQAIRRLRREAGGAKIVDERTRLTRQLTGLDDERRNIESLFRSGRRDLDWFDREDAAITARAELLRGELAALPVETDGDEIRSASAALATISALIADATPDALGAVVDQLGTIVVDERGVRLDYVESVAALIPSPTVVDPHKIPRV